MQCSVINSHLSKLTSHFKGDTSILTHTKSLVETGSPAGDSNHHAIPQRERGSPGFVLCPSSVPVPLSLPWCWSNTCWGGSIVNWLEAGWLLSSANKAAHRSQLMAQLLGPSGTLWTGRFLITIRRKCRYYPSPANCHQVIRVQDHANHQY